ncbi:hypothetical protein ACFQ3R_00095 [Mesonia ostreae]|uniref:Lipoprotein n=1 Tax=Mesonia ostreae TaxID=861110 RepID=A0ABU2KJS2_9FLAO|nr:hypothetical protein [Mesonia ostreae]MDT0294908.1 hypothetical protein [Mesonia ostreae]
MVKKLSLTVNNIFSILLFLLCFLGFVSCGTKESKDTVAKKEKISLDNPIQQTVNFVPDSTINNVLTLNNSKSSKQFYPEISSSVELIERLRESPVLAFNSKAKEYLLLYQYEGGVKNEFSCFEIGYISNLGENETINTDYKNFETESGLKLGLSSEELIKIKGASYSKEGNKIVYRMDDYPNSNFLKKYNMPAYFLECTLKNNKINRIKFGFDYP